jgi:hypothetical protein
MALQLSARQLAESEGRGRATFGTDWSGQQTATEPLRRAVEWYLAGQSLTDATKLLDNAIRSASDRAAIIRAADELRTLLSDFEQT